MSLNEVTPQEWDRIAAMDAPSPLELAAKAFHESCAAQDRADRLFKQANPKSGECVVVDGVVYRVESCRNNNPMHCPLRFYRLGEISGAER